MKKPLLVALSMLLFATAVFSQFTFYLIDNFEDGNFSEGPKWWCFGDLKVEVTKNPSPEVRDLIAESCGDYSLHLCGKTKGWYIGGIGTDLGVDATRFSRFQIDISGNKLDSGKLKIELFDDDNLNYSIEQDPQKNYEPVFDDKWVVEVMILGRGFSRISIPFSAFKEGNPGVGDDLWNPFQAGGSGGLLKMQLVAISADKEGATDFNIDNLLLTY